MTPESIVASLEWAKNLKEAGWPQQQDAFAWTKINLDAEFDVRSQMTLTHVAFPDNSRFAAPTAEEILRRLPPRCGHHWLTVKAMDSGRWSVTYSSSLGEKARFTNSSLANAASAMYCYLAEHNLLPA